MKDRWEVYQRLMNGFFPEQPCYCIEILEWINVEDITDEWRYIWKHDPPEPVYAVMMGGFVESLNLAFVYESISVSYTHLDVYKRQILIGVLNGIYMISSFRSTGSCFVIP